jgi:hypothetical protein
LWAVDHCQLCLGWSTAHTFSRSSNWWLLDQKIHVFTNNQLLLGIDAEFELLKLLTPPKIGRVFCSKVQFHKRIEKKDIRPWLRSV